MDIKAEEISKIIRDLVDFSRERYTTIVADAKKGGATGSLARGLLKKLEAAGAKVELK